MEWIISHCNSIYCRIHWKVNYHQLIQGWGQMSDSGNLATWSAPLKKKWDLNRIRRAEEHCLNQCFYQKGSTMLICLMNRVIIRHNTLINKWILTKMGAKRHIFINLELIIYIGNWDNLIIGKVHLKYLKIIVNLLNESVFQSNKWLKN